MSLVWLSIEKGDRAGAGSGPHEETCTKPAPDQLSPLFLVEKTYWPVGSWPLTALFYIWIWHSVETFAIDGQVLLWMHFPPPSLLQYQMLTNFEPPLCVTPGHHKAVSCLLFPSSVFLVLISLSLKTSCALVIFISELGVPLYFLCFSHVCFDLLTNLQDVLEYKGVFKSLLHSSSLFQPQVLSIHCLCTEYYFREWIWGHYEMPVTIDRFS